MNRGSSRGGSRGRGSSKGRSKSPSKRGGSVKKSGETYAEREIWSGRFKGWSRYEVKRPRLPNEADKADWIETYRGRPTTIGNLIGDYNDAACRTLNQYMQQFESTKNMTDLVIIGGPAGSGKTMLAQIYATTLGEDILDLPSSQYNKWCMTADAKKYDASNYHELWKKIKEFIELPVDSKTVRVPFKLMVLDDADTISATHQNSMKTLMDKNSLNLKWVFTSREPRKFIQYLQTKAAMVNCKAPGEKDALLILLSFCHRFRIGFERTGLQALFKLMAERNKGRINLTDLMRLLQKCYLTRQYVSEDNVYVAAGKPRPKVVVGPYAAIQPFPRCKICTLYPPCKHRDLETLIAQATARRRELPERKGGLECREFLRTGACSIFNKHKHCSLDHPTRKVVVEKLQRRCAVCTITWPCNHCSYSVERNKLVALREEIYRRLELLSLLTEEEPPVYLITHLVDKYEDWQDTLKGIKKFYVTREREAVMLEIEKWIDSEYSTEGVEYEFKIARLKRTYAEVLSTPLLEEKKSGASRGRSRGESRAKSGDVGSIASGSDVGFKVGDEVDGMSVGSLGSAKISIKSGSSKK